MQLCTRAKKLSNCTCLGVGSETLLVSVLIDCRTSGPLWPHVVALGYMILAIEVVCSFHQ